MRAEREPNEALVKQNMQKAREVIRDFATKLGLSHDAKDPSRRYLAYHADLVLSYADWYEALLGGGSEAQREVAKAALTETVHRIEPHVHEVFDANLYKVTHFRRYV